MPSTYLTLSLGLQTNTIFHKKIDRDGFLYILGRKDNKIILDNGCVVIPEVLEQIILNQSDCISEIKIICDSICGDGLTALVVPSLKNIAYELVDKEIKRISIRHFRHIRIKKIVVLHEGFKYSSLHKVKHIG